MAFVYLIAIIVIIWAIWRMHRQHQNEDALASHSDNDLKLLSPNKMNYMIVGDGIVFSNYFFKGEKPRHLDDTIFYADNENRVGFILDKQYPVGLVKPEEKTELLQRLEKYPNNVAQDFLPVSFGQQSAVSLGLSYTDAFLYHTKTGAKDFCITADPKHKHYTLVNVDFDPKYETTYSTEAQGHAGSALVGALLAGPAGAMIGGSRKKNSTTTKHTEEKKSYAMLTLADEDGKLFDVAILTLQSQVNSLRVLYLDRNHMKEIKQQNSTTNNDQNKTVDTADAIAKFKKLLDSGAVTQEEFDAKKKQLLGL